MRDWIRKRLAQASVPHEKIEGHTHGVWTIIRGETSPTMPEQFDPITEQQFEEKYGRHLEKYLKMTKNGRIAFEEKPPANEPGENQRWFGTGGNSPKN